MIAINAYSGRVRVSAQEPGAPGDVELRVTSESHETWVVLDCRDALVLGHALIAYAGKP